MKKLSADEIDRFQEIGKWLGQFSIALRPMAESMLLHLRFVSRDEYSEWFKSTVTGLRSEAPLALFAVRKLPKVDGQIAVYFDDGGNPAFRPPQSLGSEDLVNSLIGNVSRSDPDRFLDHPDIGRMRTKKVRDIVIVDDSIGSGNRVVEFMRAMARSKTLLSWWSYGLVRFTILSFARTKEAERLIVDSMIGSNHPKRRFPKKTKIHFYSERVYSASDLRKRWGNRYEEILRVCDSVTKVPTRYRRGYGKVMANIVFYHSVPNNIPGAFFYKGKKWDPLFPGRTLPDWMVVLLEEEESYSEADTWTRLSGAMVEFLALAKRGLRNKEIVAQRMGRDVDYVESLFNAARGLGLLSEKGRITKAGMDAYFANSKRRDRRSYDYSLYVPSSWCVGREAVQPSKREEDSSGAETDLTEFDSVGGEVGQASLEETDVKATPFCAESHRPSESRESLCTDGSVDLKE